MNLSHLNWLRELPGRPTIVAEVKLRSPYGWVNPMDEWDAFELCCAVGDVISIHTDELWGGSFDTLARLGREAHLRGKQVLAKGFHPTAPHVKRALDAGADQCLTVDWWPGDYGADGAWPEMVELGKRCWFETCSYDKARDAKAAWVVINTRNPRTGQTYGPAAWDVRNHYRKGWLCQASGIRGPQDVVPGVDAILIGEGLYTTSP